MLVQMSFRVSLGRKIKSYFCSSYRRLLTLFTISLVAFTLAWSLYTFFIVFRQMDNVQVQIRGYSYIYNLSTVLRNQRYSIEQLVSSRKLGVEPLDLRVSSATVSVLLDRIRGDAVADQSILYLCRGIENGLDYILERLPRVNSADTEEVERYALVYNILGVYNYIINYADDKLLSRFSANQVGRIAETQRLIGWYRNGVLLALLASACIFVLLAVMVTKKLTVPVQHMVSTAKEIAAGNLEIPDLVPSGTDEMQVLELALNAMKANLKRDLAIRAEKNQLTRELELARFSALQSQIHPHFLFNTLNTINRTALQEGADRTLRLIQALSGILRFNLEHRKTVSLKEELDFILQYMHVQQTRFSDRISFRYECSVDTSEVIVPPLIVQPFVENAVVHGLEQSEDGGSLLLRVSGDEESVSIGIYDTGVGMDSEALRRVLGESAEGEPTRIGIPNVLRRIQLYYRGVAKILISPNEPRGLRVDLKLPLRWSR